jgi:hypothetical protein
MTHSTPSVARGANGLGLSLVALLGLTHGATANPGNDTAFGRSLAFCGDINRDGYEDIAVGSPLAGDKEEGAIFIYSGKDYRQLTARGESAPAARALHAATRMS